MKKIYSILFPLFVFFIGLLNVVEGDEIGASDQKQALAYPVMGTLKAHRTTKVISQVSGRIKEIFVDVGDRVEKGQPLLQIDPLFLEIEWKKFHALAQVAQAAFEDSERELKRMTHLWEKKEGELPSISLKQYEDASLRFKQKKALLEQATAEEEYAKQKLVESSVCAPYGGVISKRWVEKGDFLSLTPPVGILELLDISHLIFEFSLPQQFVGLIKEGMVVYVRPDKNTAPIEARIQMIYPQIEETTRTFTCRAWLLNEEGRLHPGQFVKGEVEILPPVEQTPLAP